MNDNDTKSAGQPEPTISLEFNREQLNSLYVLRDCTTEPDKDKLVRAIRYISGMLDHAGHRIDAFYEQDVYHGITSEHIIAFLYREHVDHFFGLAEFEEQLASTLEWLASDRGQRSAESDLGNCPICGQSDGCLNVGRRHWIVCWIHKFAWCAGENMFSNWRDESRLTHECNAFILQWFFRTPEGEELNLSCKGGEGLASVQGRGRR